MIEKKLKSGRKIIIREDISIDTVDDIKDIPTIIFRKNENGVEEPETIKGLSKQKTSWIRAGLCGGTFEGWGKTPNGAIPPDMVLRQLTESEKDQLVDLIQKAQFVNPKKPSSSN